MKEDRPRDADQVAAAAVVGATAIAAGTGIAAAPGAEDHEQPITGRGL